MAVEGVSQVSASYSTKLCCAGFTPIIHRVAQELTAAMLMACKISPPADHNFPMSNQRNKYLHNALAQVNGAHKNTRDLLCFPQCKYYSFDNEQCFLCHTCVTLTFSMQILFSAKSASKIGKNISRTKFSPMNTRTDTNNKITRVSLL